VFISREDGVIDTSLYGNKVALCQKNAAALN